MRDRLASQEIEKRKVKREHLHVEETSISSYDDIVTEFEESKRGLYQLTEAKKVDFSFSM